MFPRGFTSFAKNFAPWLIIYQNLNLPVNNFSHLAEFFPYQSKSFFVFFATKFAYNIGCMFKLKIF